MRYRNRLLYYIAVLVVLVTILLLYDPSNKCIISTSSNTNTTELQPFFGIWCGKVCWMNYVSDEFYHIWKDLEDVYGWKDVSPIGVFNRSWRVNDTIHSYYTRYFGRIPDLILYPEAFGMVKIHSELLDWQLIRHPWVFMDDIHAFTADQLRKKKIALMAVKNILSAYPYKFDEEYSRENKTGVQQWFTFDRTWLPHSASPSFHMEYNRNPKMKILLSGAINVAYPYRQMVLNIYNNKSHNLSSFIDYHKHPGYQAVTNTTVSATREGYARMINGYFAAITDTLSRNYIIAKIFEIPASGALLLLNSEAIPILDRLHWFVNVHYVAYNRTNMESVLEDVLSSKSYDKYEKIRWTGHETALKFHTTKRRAAYLHDLAMNAYNHG